MDIKKKLLRIFKDANCFYECAQRVLGEQNKNGGMDIVQDSKILMLKAPFIVNIAFACELYFKTLILNNGTKVPKTHKLIDLYNKLSSEQQKMLYSLFNSSEGETIEQTKTKFVSSLEASSDLFTKYRYGFEDDKLPSVQAMFFLNLAEYLHNICQNHVEE